MDGCCLYIEAIAELRSHVEMKMSSWCFFCRSKAPSWSLQAQLRVGEAAKQRASEPHLFTHLSLARASMKIWCIFKSYTAIKWRENAIASAFRVPLIKRDAGVSEQTTIKWDTFLTFRIPL
jgi:hypothetical protein